LLSKHVNKLVIKRIGVELSITSSIYFKK